VAAHKFLPGRAIALETLLDQLGILLQASSAPSSRHLLRQHPQVGFSACQCMERKMHRKCSRLRGSPNRPFGWHLTRSRPQLQRLLLQPVGIKLLIPA
jgi:hypothetical protein